MYFIRGLGFPVGHNLHDSPSPYLWSVHFFTCLAWSALGFAIPLGSQYAHQLTWYATIKCCKLMSCHLGSCLYLLWVWLVWVSSSGTDLQHLNQNQMYGLAQGEAQFPPRGSASADISYALNITPAYHLSSWIPQCPENTCHMTSEGQRHHSPAELQMRHWPS